MERRSVARRSQTVEPLILGVGSGIYFQILSQIQKCVLGLWPIALGKVNPGFRPSVGRLPENIFD